LFDQAEREAFAVETALIRFRYILDSLAFNPVIISDSYLFQVENQSVNSVD